MSGSTGTFSRSFTLPNTVDGNRISAAYKDGVLTVRVPQREETKPKQIEVDVDAARNRAVHVRRGWEGE